MTYRTDVERRGDCESLEDACVGEDPRLGAGRREGISVMLVDDEHALTEEIAEVLCAERIDVSLASDGLEAFSLAQKRLPSMIIVDKTMPGLSGLGLVRNLRTLPGGETLHILMMSAFFTSAERAEGKRLGVNRFLEKPFDLDAVVEWVFERFDANQAPQNKTLPRSARLESRVAQLESQVARLEDELRDCRDLINGSTGRSREGEDA